MKEYDYLFKYLEVEGININKEEFIFQVQSHPDYPSLLSISDTLSFLKVNSYAASISKDEIIGLPKYFIAFLNVELREPTMFFVKNDSENFYKLYSKNAEEVIDKKELESRWKDIVLIAEPRDGNQKKFDSKNNIFLFLILFSTSFLAIVYYFSGSLSFALLCLLPIIGLFLSIEALKSELGLESKISQKFCNIIPNSDCSQVINSTKSQWFQKVKISDISFWFFTSQLLSILIFSFAHLSVDFLYIMLISLTLSMPITLYSIYFQYKVEEKWCPICLSIIGVIYLELSYLLFIDISNKLNIRSIILFSSVFCLVAVVLYLIKPVFLEKKDISEKYIKQLRLSRNYELFKNTLVKTEAQFFEKEYIVLGNKKSKHKISIITSPLCGFCKEAHQEIDGIYNRFGKNIGISVRFNYDENSPSKNLYLKLAEIYENKGDKDFMLALNNWFENKNLNQWLVRYGNIDNTEIIEQRLLEVAFENRKKKLNFTPNLFLNQFNYPKQYEIENLQFFIADWLEDEKL